MQKLLLIIGMCFVNISIYTQESALSVTATNYAKMPLLLIHIKTKDEVKQLCDVTTIQHDLEFTRQFTVTIHERSRILSKKEKKALLKEGFALAIYVESHENTIDWWVEDLMTHKLQGGKKYTKKGTELRGWSHQIADGIWHVLTNNPGFFSTRIAYCKEINPKEGSRRKQLCIADYDGSHEAVIVDLPTIVLGPRWNNDHTNPLIFYSEHTNINVRLMVVDMHRRRHIASNFDGFNMLPSFSHDGKEVVYCRSSEDGYCQLHLYKNGELSQITDFTANNLSPAMSADGTWIYFCSDLKDNLPHIFAYNLHTKELVQITHKDYAVSPVYCAANRQLAYLRMVHGIMQVFVYDTITKVHTQLTFDDGNKADCAWSPCGNYLLFGLKTKNNQRIVMMNTISQNYFYLTASSAQCSDPAWSPIYHEFPMVSI